MWPSICRLTACARWTANFAPRTTHLAAVIRNPAWKVAGWKHMLDACVSCALVMNAETFARTEWRQLRHRFKSGRFSLPHSRVLGKDRAGALVDLHTHTYH